MRNVIYKDLILGKFTFMTFALLITFVVVLYTGIGVPPGVFFLFAGLVSAFVPISALCEEEKSRGLVLARSLPVSLNTLVASKYAGAWLMALMGLAFAVLVGLTMPTSSLRMPGALTVRTIGIAISIVGIVIAMVYPFTIRFGATGVLIGGLTAHLLGTVVFATQVIFPRSLGLKAMIRGTLEALRGARGQLGDPFYYACVIAAVLVLNAGSYVASTCLLKSRDL